ncbi:MAG TPA: hypothetical protein PKD99_06285, partial [Sphingopyxis sp.]|nr:hypothetical protein [Sphingopyxis sp.]
ASATPIRPSLPMMPMLVMILSPELPDPFSRSHRAKSRHALFLPRHPGEGRDLDLSSCRTGEIPAFAGMTL